MTDGVQDKCHPPKVPLMESLLAELAESKVAMQSIVPPTHCGKRQNMRQKDADWSASIA